MGLQKTAKMLESETRQEEQESRSPITLEINSSYWCGLTKEQMDRWRIYGVLKDNNPAQTKIERFICFLTKRKEIREIYLTSDIKKRSKGDSREGKLRKDRLGKIKGWMNRQNMALPIFWATQTEVKKKMKREQEKDELKVIKSLAQREDVPSESAKTIIEWKLNRGEIREILQLLAAERKLQTAFTNLVGSTRFKAVKGGKLRKTICPRCQAIDSWGHCMSCYEVRAEGAKEDRQWLQKIEKATDVPATYTASEIEHQHAKG